MDVKWLHRAVLDLDEVEAYLNQVNPAAAAKMVLKIVRAVSVLREHPGLGRVGRVPGTKEFVVPQTRYIIPYRIKDDLLQILRVYHSSRIWPGRL